MNSVAVDDDFAATYVLGPNLGGDERSVPHASFDLPGFGRTVDIYLPNAVFWSHLTQTIVLVSLFGIVLSGVVRSCVVKRRGSALSYLVGIAVICATVFFPYAIIHVLGVQNLVTKFSLCAFTTLYLFRTSEAIFGFSPAGVEDSPKSYLWYYAFPVELELDRKTAKPVEATKYEVAENALMLLKAFLQLCIMFSLFAPHSFEPFDGRPAPGSSPLSYFNLGHLGNCFMAAYMFQLGLAFYGHAMTAVVNLSAGWKTIVPMNNPLLEATSPSDFWGRRWNVLVHGVLKRGVYKPVRKYGGSSHLASLAAFAASGLFHEWIIHVMSYRHRGCSASCNESLFGSNMAFFVWNAAIIMGETALRQSGVFQKVGGAVPRFLVTFLVVMTSLPVAHWFGDPYICQGFFNHYQQGFPLVAIK